MVSVLYVFMLRAQAEAEKPDTSPGMSLRLKSAQDK